MSIWLPTLLAVIVTAMALTGADTAAFGRVARRFWMGSAFLVGSLAIAATVWQAQRTDHEVAALSGTTALSQASSSPPNGATISVLMKKVRTLEDRVKELEAMRQSRDITPEAADQLAAYLKRSGARRVVVSCIPDDVEAYRYANQLVNILNAADWDAQGPQVTTVFGDVRAPGINLYVNREDHSDTAAILLDAFKKFNIPYQGRVTPSQAIPDAETVELFIGTRRSERVKAGADEIPAR